MSWSQPSGGSTRFAAVILAAGSALTRGRPTQLYPYLGRSLIEHATLTALAAGAAEVVVVAGERVAEIRERLGRLPVRVVENREWRTGMASSIRAGISNLRSNPAVAVICLADQPRITSDHIRSLASRALSGLEIAASAYEGVIGAPAAFSRSVFPRLLALRGHEGARQLIRSGEIAVETICFDHANDEVEVRAPLEPLSPRTTANRQRPAKRPHASRAPPNQLAFAV